MAICFSPHHAGYTTSAVSKSRTAKAIAVAPPSVGVLPPEGASATQPLLK